ncbi:glycosyltransferase family 8 protein [Streptococcus parasanguinis]|uniref:glycosyltransferase family 8 protein n=1 Tax=Streptococcus parasanguinis TaxID=1318 RepID=UPI00352CFD73
MKKAIVLGADNGYMDKVETTIKSVCAHNDHIKFYVFNDDLPSEWFRVMNKRLKTIHSEIVNVKISDHSLRNYRLAISYLSYAAYFRYFIGEFVEEERAIYLDSDIIVTGSLDNLYNVALEEYMLAGVPDYFDGDYTGDFNSGMMVIPVTRWKQEQVASQLLELTEQYHQTVFGDQGILNILFRGQWKKLNRLNNFMVGMDTLAQSVNDRAWYDSALPEGAYPLIIHYTDDKPWYHLSNNRYRSTWWFYYSVDWSDILLRKNPINENEVGDWHTLIEPPKYYTAIFTDSCKLEQIEIFLKELPQVHFTILAHTVFASSVIDLQKYENVSIHPGFTPFNLDDIMSKLDFYLDINHGNQIADIINKVHNIGKPVYAFDVTNHDNYGRSRVFPVSEVDLMINEIKLELDLKKER